MSINQKNFKIFRVNLILTAVVIIAVAFFIEITLGTGLQASSRTEYDLSFMESPDLSLETFAGPAFTAEDIKTHELTVLNVWATTCVSCIEEMPTFEEFSHADPARVQIIGTVSDIYNSDWTINDDKYGDAARILSDTGVTYPTLIASAEMADGLISMVTATPVTFYLDKNGRVLGSNMGAVSKEEWESRIEKYLAIAANADAAAPDPALSADATGAPASANADSATSDSVQSTDTAGKGA
ncbi:MAG: TlpA disulfide reductase family protein [Eubacteriales bacterium]|nr:TlpA disulfide reductase family protein [Eubacteriales bacterium]